jgi:AcrR family transcriptional regulator
VAIEERRRRRYVEAAAEILYEFGHAGLTSTSIVQVAGTARTSFYGAFSGVEACFDYAIELADAELFAALDDPRRDGAWARDLLAARRVRMRELASLPEEAPSMTALVGGFYFGPERAAKMLVAQVAA